MQRLSSSTRRTIILWFELILTQSPLFPVPLDKISKDSGDEIGSTNNRFSTRIPEQLIGFPLHCPVCKHVLATTPSVLPYPLWHPNTQVDPYVLPHEEVINVAFGGMLRTEQVTTYPKNKFPGLWLVLYTESDFKPNVLQLNQLHYDIVFKC